MLGADFLFSFDEGPGTNNPVNLSESFGVSADSKLKIAILRLGPTLNVELMQYVTSDQRRDMPRNSDFDAPHIAFFVRDMEKAADYLLKHGYKLFSGPLLSREGPKAGQSIRIFRCHGACSWKSSRGLSICRTSKGQHHAYSDLTVTGGQVIPKQEKEKR